MRSPIQRSSGEGPRAAVATAVLCSLALVAAGCGEDSSETDAPAPKARAPRAVTVDIASFKFGPQAVTVKAGGTVTFVNRDKAPHTAQTELNKVAAEFDTDRLAKGERKAVELRNPGRFSYFCAFHRFMEGTVKVVE